ncbi:MAG: hypothetical protein D6723_09595 [Acidobacteria bacterium]|nr:MAG: hypothetical protein D6723_09595 [Acidobacteriota bacterium]
MNRCLISYHGFIFLVTSAMLATVLPIKGTVRHEREGRITSLSYRLVEKIRLEGDPEIFRLAVDAEGNFYIRGREGSVVKKYAPSGRHLLTIDLTEVLKTSRISVYDLFIHPRGALYLLVVWIAPDGSRPSGGVLILDGQGQVRRLIELGLILRITGRRSLVVDSTGAFYILALLQRTHDPDSPLVTENVIHKFAPSGELLHSFSPLTGRFTRQRCLDTREFQTLLIDDQDRIHHIYLDGTEIRSFTPDGHLLSLYRIPYPVRPRPIEESEKSIARIERSIVGAFAWKDALILSLSETPLTATGEAVGFPEGYALMIDPLKKSMRIVGRGNALVPGTMLGRDGYCYAFSHHHENGQAWFVIHKEELVQQ